MSDLKRIAGGTLGALAFTAIAYYVYVPIGETLVTLIGYLIGHACAALLDRGGPLPERSPAIGRLAGQPPQWLWIARRISVIVAVLAFLLGDRVLFELGLGGLTRKLLAVIIGCSTHALGTWLTRWPRRLDPEAR